MSADPTAPPPAEEPPKTLFDKIGAALPIALTAVATAFAGLSSSEMSRAMYWRSAAAQDQAKVNDQWSLAGFKRDRSLIVQTAAAQLRAGGAAAYTPPPLTPAEDQTPAAATAREWLAGKGPPKAELPEVEDPLIRQVMAAIRGRRPEAEVVALARGIDPAKLEAAIGAAAEAVAKAEEDTDAVLKEADRLAQGSTAAQAARFELDYRRYRAEATMNQGLGFLYEVRVKASTAQSDRHRVRSENFFYAMLAGQIGAVIASLQLARKHGSALWGLAGMAGLVAVVFGVYVYLGM